MTWLEFCVTVLAVCSVAVLFLLGNISLFLRDIKNEVSKISIEQNRLLNESKTLQHDRKITDRNIERMKDIASDFHLELMKKLTAEGIRDRLQRKARERAAENSNEGEN